jgi:hypothetical protein
MTQILAGWAICQTRIKQLVPDPRENATLSPGPQVETFLPIDNEAAVEGVSDRARGSSRVLPARREMGAGQSA